jgi:hypothetical protein
MQKRGIIMKIAVTFSGNGNSFEAGRIVASEIIENGVSDADFALIFATNNYNIPDVLRGFKKEMLTKIAGFSSQGLIFGGKLHKSGVGAIVVKQGNIKAKTFLESDINILNKKIKRAIDKNDIKEGSLFIFPYGIFRNIEELLRTLYNTTNSSFRIIGGASGTNFKPDMNCEFNEKKSMKDAVSVLLIENNKIHLSVGIEHGWVPYGDFMIITRSKGRILYEINNMPAFDVYRSIVKGITIKNFPEKAMFFPLGFQDINGKFYIRDPIKANSDGSIEFISEIPQNSVSYIMHGDTKDLILSAGRSVKKSIAKLKKTGALLVFDCVSRELLMKENFKKEISEIYKFSGKIPLLGVLTFGEIGGNNEAPIFHNKTALSIAIGE